MAGPDFSVALADLDRSLSSIEAVVDPDRKRAEIAELEQQVAAPDLWDNPDNAVQAEPAGQVDLLGIVPGIVLVGVTDVATEKLDP